MEINTERDGLIDHFLELAYPSKERPNASSMSKLTVAELRRLISIFEQLKEHADSSSATKIDVNQHKTWNADELGVSGTLTQFRTFLGEIDPLVLLSYMSFVTYCRSTETGASLIPQLFSQPEIELVQAILLTRAHKQGRRVFMSPRDEGTILAYLHDIVDLKVEDGAMLKIKDVYGADDLIQLVRHQTITRRNPTYPRIVLSMYRELFAPLRQNIKSLVGYTPDEIISIFEKASALLGIRCSAYYEKIKQFGKVSTRSKIWDAFIKNFNPNRSETRELGKIKSQLPEDIPQFRDAVTHLSFRWLKKIYRFSVEDFQDIDISQEKLVELINFLSISFGELAESNTDFFFMNNPVWTRPLVRIEPSVFGVYSLGTFYGFSSNIIHNWICKKTPFKTSFEARKAAYLEEKVGAILKRFFSTQQIFQGVLRHEGTHGEEGENDIVLFIDGLLVVCEAKAAKVDPIALRGATNSLKSTINELISIPATQASSLISHLKTTNGVQKFSSKSGDFIVDADEIKNVIRLSVSFDWLGPLASASKRLVHAGFVLSQVNLSISLSLFDLILISEVLPNALQFIHYFRRRRELEENSFSLDSETDLLGLYVKTGFCIGEREFDSTSLDAYYATSIFDAHFTQPEDSGIPIPGRKISSLWRELLDTLETEKIVNWIDLGCSLLNVSYEEQVDVMRQTATMLNQKNSTNRFETCKVEFGHNSRKQRFSFVVHNFLNLAEIQNIVAEKLEEPLGESLSHTVAAFSRTTKLNAFGFRKIVSPLV